MNAASATKVRERRRIVRWDPGTDTLIAAVTLLAFWGCYWAGSTINEWFLWIGIIVVGTIIPAWTVLMFRREGLSGLGITRRLLVTSLIVSAVLGAGSAYQLFQAAGEAGVDAVPHLVANVLVFWEPFFVFGWLFLRWERAFGWLPAIVLTAAGFTLQHVGAVPLEMTLFFGAFALVFGIVFAITRNLFILWPLFYGVASGIGTIQSGLAMGWDTVIMSAVVLVVQIGVIAAFVTAARTRAVPED